VLRFNSRQRSGRPHTDETLRVAQRLGERGDRLRCHVANLRERVRSQTPLQRIAALQCCDPAGGRNSQI